MLQDLIDNRKLPSLMVNAQGKNVRTVDEWLARRRELIELLSREEYGFTPPAPVNVTGEVTESGDAFAEKAVMESVTISFTTPKGIFSFPIKLIYPKGRVNTPVFVYIAFRHEIPDKYVPAEEIIDRGYAIAVMCYKDVTSDGPDLDGLAAMYYREGDSCWGKIGMWAFAASRVLDYLETRPEVDATRACVNGHSRLGKTALWCGAQDERFAMVVSNDSGCSGAAITCDKTGETVEKIYRVFPFWFCERYGTWANREHEMPFDQHMLLSLVAPRRLYVCSAQTDDWADPRSEFLSACAASEAWRLLRVPGLITPDELPALDAPLQDGGVCYHVRTGSHFHSRTDWVWHMDARDRYGV